MVIYSTKQNYLIFFIIYWYKENYDRYIFNNIDIKRNM